MGQVASGRIGSGWVQCHKYVYTIYNLYANSRLFDDWFIKTRSSNIAIHYRLIIYSNIKDAKTRCFGKWQWLVKRWCHLSWKAIWWTSWRIRKLMAKLKFVHKWVGLSQVQSFVLILGRVGSGHFTCGLGQENRTPFNSWLTLTVTLTMIYAKVISIFSKQAQLYGHQHHWANKTAKERQRHLTNGKPRPNSVLAGIYSDLLGVMTPLAFYATPPNIGPTCGKGMLLWKPVLHY